MPGARTWVERVARSLATGENVFAVFPATANPLPVMSNVIAFAQDVRGCTATEFDLKDLDWSHPPIVSLAAALRLSLADRITTPDEFVALEESPNIILASGFDTLTSEHARQWVALIQRFARISRGDHTPAPVFICPTGQPSKLELLPSAAPRLAIQWWTGIPSATELRLACRGDAAEVGDRARQLWREHLLPSLSGNDAALAECLWDAVFEPQDGVRRALLSYAKERGWADDVLRGAGADRLRPQPTTSRQGEAPAWPGLWALGAVSSTDEHGLELHAATLPVLGLEAELSQRFWRAQASLAFPLLEDLRLRICQRLSVAFGEDWPTRWASPVFDEERTDLGETPLSASWGFLMHLYRVAPPLVRDLKTSALVARSRYLRNFLSHNRLIVFADFKGFYDALTEFISQE